jgi:hypothetical protein
LDYALARVLARSGERLDEAAWRRLDANRELSLYLAAVRSTSMADWVGGFDPEHNCHTFESALRARWRRYVEAVAIWHPEGWQAWLSWLVWLPGLSLLAQLARSESAPAWLLADSVFGRIAPGTPAERIAALAQSPLATLEPVLEGRISAGQAWIDHWHTLLPSTDLRSASLLGLVLRAIAQHQRQLLHAADSSEALREELANRLQRLLRMSAGTVIVSLCHLALVALDLERLRGALACRRLFADRRELP